MDSVVYDLLINVWYVDECSACVHHIYVSHCVKRWFDTFDLEAHALRARQRNQEW